MIPHDAFGSRELEIVDISISVIIKLYTYSQFWQLLISGHLLLGVLLWWCLNTSETMAL